MWQSSTGGRGQKEAGVFTRKGFLCGLGLFFNDQRCPFLIPPHLVCVPELNKVPGTGQGALELLL